MSTHHADVTVMNLKQTNSDVPVLVGQREIGITRSTDRYPVLATRNVNMCVCLYGYDDVSQVGFLCHFDFPFNTEVLPELAKRLAKHAGSDARFECGIIGGMRWTWARSGTIRERIYTTLLELSDLGGVQFKMVGDTPLPGFWRGLVTPPLALQIDTRSGETSPCPGGSLTLPLKRLLTLDDVQFVYEPHR